MRLAALILIATVLPAGAQTYLGKYQNGTLVGTATLDKSGASAPTDGSCAGCQIITQSQYQAFQLGVAASAISANPPVTCSGAPTASFKVTNGVVTGC